jgi:hypothetical protein
LEQEFLVVGFGFGQRQKIKQIPEAKIRLQIIGLGCFDQAANRRTVIGPAGMVPEEPGLSYYRKVF